VLDQIAAEYNNSIVYIVETKGKSIYLLVMISQNGLIVIGRTSLLCHKPEVSKLAYHM